MLMAPLKFSKYRLLYSLVVFTFYLPKEVLRFVDATEILCDEDASARNDGYILEVDLGLSYTGKNTRQGERTLSEVARYDCFLKTLSHIASKTKTNKEPLDYQIKLSDTKKKFTLSSPKVNIQSYNTYGFDEDAALVSPTLPFRAEIPNY